MELGNRSVELTYSLTFRANSMGNLIGAFILYTSIDQTLQLELPTKARMICYTMCRTSRRWCIVSLV